MKNDGGNPSGPGYWFVGTRPIPSAIINIKNSVLACPKGDGGYFPQKARLDRTHFRTDRTLLEKSALEAFASDTRVFEPYLWAWLVTRGEMWKTHWANPDAPNKVGPPTSATVNEVHGNVNIETDSEVDSEDGWDPNDDLDEMLRRYLTGGL